jgi:protein-tyrosine phosphatase
MKKVLFLCTGNYYRSRFAEELFNHLTGAAGIPWRADSRALAIERGVENVGPMSRHTAEALHERGIKPEEPLRYPLELNEQDLRSSARVIALKEAEHRPLVESRFAAFAGRVEYWHVHDLDGAAPQEALAQVEVLVRELVAGLVAEQGR